MEWFPLLLVFCGSALGGIARYGLSGFVASRWGESFPLGTLVVNISGGFLIGLLWTVLGPGETPGRTWLAEVLIFGFLGGYTTVSSFALNTWNLVRDGQWLPALANVLGSWLLCLGAAFVGAKLGAWL